MKYYVDDHGTIEDAEMIPDCDCSETTAGLAWAAEYAAEDYHSNHDGWEATWPLTFVVLDDELNELGRFSVDREAVPQFHASKIEVPKEVIPF